MMHNITIDTDHPDGGDWAVTLSYRTTEVVNDHKRIVRPQLNTRITAKTHPDARQSTAEHIDRLLAILNEAKTLISPY